MMTTVTPREAARYVCVTIVLTITLISVLACGAEDSPATQPSPYTPSISHVIIEIDYAPGADPYTGATGSSDTWSLFQVNAAAILPADVTLTSPDNLEEMQALPELEQISFTVDDILTLADLHRDQLSDETTITYYGIWLNGYFSDGGEDQTSVLGVSIGNTGVIAMFKPVVKSLGGLEVVRRFGEQTVFIHEFGHAVGLVNNGVDMITDHRICTIPCMARILRNPRCKG